MKYCIKCGDSINEKDINEKWCMIISKKGEKTTDFKCFHFKCWEKFFNDSVLMKIKEMEEI